MKRVKLAQAVKELGRTDPEKRICKVNRKLSPQVRQ